MENAHVYLTGQPVVTQTHARGVSAAPGSRAFVTRLRKIHSAARPRNTTTLTALDKFMLREPDNIGKRKRCCASNPARISAGSPRDSGPNNSTSSAWNGISEKRVLPLVVSADD